MYVHIYIYIYTYKHTHINIYIFITHIYTYTCILPNIVESSCLGDIGGDRERSRWLSSLSLPSHQIYIYIHIFI
jgi:hypothetical protein